jgi:hypothetical protein
LAVVSPPREETTPRGAVVETAHKAAETLARQTFHDHHDDLLRDSCRSIVGGQQPHWLGGADFQLDESPRRSAQIRKQDVTMAVQSAIDGVKGRISWFGDDARVAVPADWPGDVEPKFKLQAGRRSVRIEMTWQRTGNW